MEKPGPKTIPKNKGSGFISRDNDDSTAAAVHEFMQTVGIPRNRVIIWNTIPGWDGKSYIAKEQWKVGLDELINLLPLLPHLKTVVLVGRKAGRAHKLLLSKGLAVVDSYHPSPKVKAIRRDLWGKIPAQWRAALENP